jgi:hypothetical protein
VCGLTLLPGGDDLPMEGWLLFLSANDLNTCGAKQAFFRANQAKKTAHCAPFFSLG